jgi:nucleoside-diphosphate-sugar epimerase
MKVVITGGTGFVGLTVARQLVARGSLSGRGGRPEPIDEIVLLDAAVPERRPAGLDDRVSIVAGDVGDAALLGSLVDRDDCSVFHLASILSGGSEADFDLAMRVNLDGGRNVLEACRARGGPIRLVFSSTVAAFGGSAMPMRVSDATKLTPETTYGTTKVILELLVNDYTRKGFLDGRAARLPTVIVRPGAPNSAASSFASAVFREPLAGKPCVLPVGLETRMPVIGHRTVAASLIALHELPPDALGDDRCINLPGISVSAGEIVESVRRVGAGRALGPIEVAPDPVIERIVATWPLAVEAPRAAPLGFPQDESLDAIARAYLADFA